MADIFISYKRERRPAARHLEQILLRHGYSVWFDVELVRGRDYEAQIERELFAAKAVIVLWCGLSVKSPGVRSEANRAKSQGKLIPLVIEPCELPLFSTLEQNIDLTTAAGSPRDHAFDPLLGDLERLVGRAPQTDYRDLVQYEATWRAMGAMPLARFPLEAAPPREVVVRDLGAASSGANDPAHDYAFWERQWEKQGNGANLVALRAIADEAPRYFAVQARARIAEIEAERRQQAEREQQAREAEASQRAEQGRVEREQAAAAQGYKAEGRIKVDAGIFHGAPKGWFKPGAGKIEWFKDIEIGPEMVVIPAGEFTMGSNDFEDEKPPHKVVIRQPFAVGRLAVTFDEWEACAAAGGCKGYRPEDQRWGRGKRPVINISWHDANEYLAWLSARTGQNYRLLSEAEWEYAARAGSLTKYPWGDEIGEGHANGRDSGCQWSGKQTAPVGSFAPNGWGLHDMHGNVWEWVEDPYHDTYAGAPKEGSVWASGGSSSRVLRGGSWAYYADGLRSAYRSHDHPDDRDVSVGFRVARTL
jgi:formylglycine-generating enzyme required for sulfatase activity